MYCGNNANNPSLVNGTKVLGTRYACLKKGKAFGYAQPVDPNFLVPYQPIDPTKKYCGNNNILPDGYDRFGNLYECYLKGVGVGKKLKAEDNNPILPPQYSFKSKNNYRFKGNLKEENFLFTGSIMSIMSIMSIISIIIMILVFSLLYYIKPNIIIDKQNEEDKKINWIKFIYLYLFICFIYFSISFICFYIFYIK